MYRQDSNTNPHPDPPQTIFLVHPARLLLKLLAMRAREHQASKPALEAAADAVSQERVRVYTAGCRFEVDAHLIRSLASA